MCANNTEKSKEYTKTRNSFDDLGAEEKAAFLVESTVQLVVSGVRQAGDAVADALKNVSADFGDGSGGPGAEAASDNAESKEDDAGPAKSTAGGKKKKSGSKKSAKGKSENTD